MSAYYTTSQAATITGASIQTIRSYTKLYARHFSTEATPESGQSRRFTSADLRLIRFCRDLAEQNLTREKIAERLAAGDLDQFAWQPAEPESAAQGGPAAESAASSPNTMLVPYERLQAAQVLLQDAQRREAEAVAEAAAQVATLQAEVQRLSLELGKAQGEAATLKGSRYTAPRWWRAVFGGRQGDAPG